MGDENCKHIQTVFPANKTNKLEDSKKYKNDSPVVSK